MNMTFADGVETVNKQLDYLLNNAELNVVEFNIHRRSEMRTFHRTLPYYVMSYHKVGKAKLRVGDRHYAIEPGTVICLPPYIEHDHYKDTNEETEFLWWHFTYEIAGVMDALKLFQIPVTFRLQVRHRTAGRRLKVLTRRICNCFAMDIALQLRLAPNITE